MGNFAENLAQLADADNFSKLELFDSAGNSVAVIENKPGSQGSLRVYLHLAEKWSAINPDAAHEGLALYAEHTGDARRNPGKHPNIDRLFEIIASGAAYSIHLTPA
ncbi:MAG: DUF2322 family protein [Sulfurimicrobium sp.]|nr:DUF2322 family protein [Sulfurimicrobium sp.]MDO9188711.1 DUF2322 family protein [Sulfurimicrobium sp.]MDP1705530.1 DUF2322 family protein [Sulfurimicrobium sp.]MDP1896854.1 DUF2322 family protein [Sulfurimicrobium sp.]MDP2197467.1 DUF2322 family protein [Sulfurimicrobium sp.]